MFVIFGFLNGLFMAICHGWRQIKQIRGWVSEYSFCSPGKRCLRTLLTFAVTLVFFKAPSVAVGMTLLSNLMGWNGVGGFSLSAVDAAFVAALLGGVWFLPNSQEMVGLLFRGEADQRSCGAYSRRVYLEAHERLGVTFVGTLGFASLIGIAIGRESPFLYFQF